MNEISRLKADLTVDVIAETLDLVRVGNRLTALCPFHEESTPSFVVFNDHYHCFGCGVHGDVFNWLENQRQLGFLDALEYLRSLVPPTEAPTTQPASPATPEKNLGLAGRIWVQAVDPRGTIVEKYLRSRGVKLPSTRVVKFHPLCPRRGEFMPAMIAAMINPSTGQFCGIHRTFLNGTAKLEKMMLGGSGVIKLADVGKGDLGLTEGIEDALSVTLKVGIKCWAAGSASGIASFPIIPGIKLHVFADNNVAGLTAAQRCADRWGEIKIFIPPGKGDWNDMITGGPR